MLSRRNRDGHERVIGTDQRGDGAVDSGAPTRIPCFQQPQITRPRRDDRCTEAVGGIVAIVHAWGLGWRRAGLWFWSIRRKKQVCSQVKALLPQSLVNLLIAQIHRR